MSDPVFLFLAHDAADHDMAAQLLAAVEALQGAPFAADYPFRIIADAPILASPEWEERFGADIDHAALFLILVTPSLGGPVKDTGLDRAITRAKAADLRMLPVIVEEALGFLQPRGLEAIRAARLPTRGAGLSQPPYNGDIGAWLGDVVDALKAAIIRLYEQTQLTASPITAVAERCRSAAARLLAAAESEAEILAARRARVDYAAERTRDLIVAISTDLLDVVPVVEAHVLEARDCADEKAAPATLRAVDNLIGELRSLARAGVAAGYRARSDVVGAPAVTLDPTAGANSKDTAGARAALDTADQTIVALTAEAETQPVASRAAIIDYATQAGAESRLARAALDAPLSDVGQLEATQAQLARTAQAGVRLGAELPPGRARTLIERVNLAVTRARGWVTRLVSRALGRPLPPEPGPEPRGGDGWSGVPRATPGEWLFPGAQWPHMIPRVDSEAWPVMVTLPPGEFMMGSPRNEKRWDGYKGEEEPRHRVRLSHVFALGRTPVTVDAFAAFVSETGYATGDSAFVRVGKTWMDAKGRGWRDPGFDQQGDHPVTCVSWFDARAYIAWLNDRLGLLGRPDAYRFPTESEWEYACRSGTQTPFSFGETISTDEANYDGNFVYGRGRKSGVYLKRTTTVGKYGQNSFGFCDMHGNVLEWCEDVWHDNYQGAPDDGSAWVIGQGSRHVVRGGSWNNIPVYCRSAARNWYGPSARNDDIGFRLARTLWPFPV